MKAARRPVRRKGRRRAPPGPFGYKCVGQGAILRPVPGAGWEPDGGIGSRAAAFSTKAFYSAAASTSASCCGGVSLTKRLPFLKPMPTKDRMMAITEQPQPKKL